MGKHYHIWTGKPHRLHRQAKAYKSSAHAASAAKVSYPDRYTRILDCWDCSE